MLARLGLRKRPAAPSRNSSFEEEFDPSQFNPFNQPDMGITDEGRPTSLFSRTPYSPVIEPNLTLTEMLELEHAYVGAGAASSLKVRWGDLPSKAALGTQAIGMGGKYKIYKSVTKPSPQKIGGRRVPRAVSYPSTIPEEGRIQQDNNTTSKSTLSFQKISGYHVPHQHTHQSQKPSRMHSDNVPARGYCKNWEPERTYSKKGHRAEHLPNQGLTRNPSQNNRIPEQSRVTIAGPISPRYPNSGSYDSGIAKGLYEDGTTKGKTPVRTGSLQFVDNRASLPSQQRVNRLQCAQAQRTDFYQCLARSRSNRAQQQREHNGLAREGKRVEQQDSESYLERKPADFAAYIAIEDGEKDRQEGILDNHMDIILDPRNAQQGRVGEIERDGEVFHPLQRFKSQRGVVGKMPTHRSMQPEDYIPSEAEELKEEVKGMRRRTSSCGKWMQKLRRSLSKKKTNAGVAIAYEV